MTDSTVNFRKISDRFPLWNPRYYAWCKFATDPLYNAVFEALAGTRLPLLDIGCGMGLNSFYLRERGCHFAMRGLDYDASKIAVAKKIAAQTAPDLVFETSDARSGLPDHSGSVTILDILQYMSAESQAALLREAAARVAPGGKLVIRSGMAAPGWRFQLTRIADWFAACCFWMKAAPVTYPSPERLAAILEGCGLRGSIRPLWGRTPFNNWLAVFERPAA
jgi:SAM-dependent methyltransferase